MSQVQRLLCCSPVLEDTSLGDQAHRIPLITAFECSFRESDSYHVISKYKQSYWFSRFVSKPKISGEVCQTLILREGGVWEQDYTCVGQGIPCVVHYILGKGRGGKWCSVGKCAVGRGCGLPMVWSNDKFFFRLYRMWQFIA